MDKIVKEIISPDKKHKVEIFQRTDGSFGFEALKYSDDHYEKCWIPYGKFSLCYTDNEKTAEEEAHDRVEWLRNINEGANG